jgi:MoaA/NifB/PqqE/SkfB family radical SAM enzyme
MKMKEGIFFNRNSCRFEVGRGEISSGVLPLSVILQITRKCNFSCVFCSETEKMEDPNLEELQRMKDNLYGVPRIYLSGGEPLLRKDLPEILDMFYGSFVVGLPTNAVIHTPEVMKILKERIDFANIGLDGPRNVTTRIRGDYDKIMKGIYRFQEYGISLSLSCVVLSSTKDTVAFTCQIADLVGAKKLKLILPIPKGNALDLPASEYLSLKEVAILFDGVKKAKENYGWTPKITLTAQGPDVEGYALLVYPNGNTCAWPVYNQSDKVLLLGNLKEESIKDIWSKNPFKQNHYNKYLGRSIFVT